MSLQRFFACSGERLYFSSSSSAEAPRGSNEVSVVDFGSSGSFVTSVNMCLTPSVPAPMNAHEAIEVRSSKPFLQYLLRAAPKSSITSSILKITLRNNVILFLPKITRKIGVIDL